MGLVTAMCLLEREGSEKLKVVEGVMECKDREEEGSRVIYNRIRWLSSAETGAADYKGPHR